MDALLQAHSWILQAVVFVAAALQAASGIGFGMVAVPVLLIAMNSAAALQTAMVLSTLVAAPLVWSTRKSLDLAVMRRMFIGSLIGMPLGVALAALLAVPVIKVCAALIVLANIAFMQGWLKLHPDTTAVQLQKGETRAGVLSGAFAVLVAMPGPPVTAYLSGTGRGKHAVRALTLSLFLVTNPFSYAAQIWATGFSPAALAMSWTLVPITLVGMVFGTLAGRRMGETVFRAVAATVMAATCVSLVASIYF